MIFLELISKYILNQNKMKTINKFLLLLPITAVLLCSYALMHKRGAGTPKAIATPSSVETSFGMSKSDG